MGLHLREVVAIAVLSNFHLGMVVLGSLSAISSVSWLVYDGMNTDWDTEEVERCEERGDGIRKCESIRVKEGTTTQVEAPFPNIGKQLLMSLGGAIILAAAFSAAKLGMV